MIAKSERLGVTSRLHLAPIYVEELIFDEAKNWGDYNWTIST